ncbi:BLUF domain-containing protein [Rhodopirellula sallentina]|nr:BLUF domain-containing protein [Rhodopirellula sallentina]
MGHHEHPQLCRLIYCSEACKPLPMESFLQIRREARDINQRDGITGILAFGEGRFMQILEGDQETVSQTYARIVLDSRHHSCKLIQFTFCPERFFEGWTMRHLTVQKEMLEEIEFFEEFQPHLWSAERCLSFALKYTVWARQNRPESSSELTIA